MCLLSLDLDKINLLCVTVIEFIRVVVLKAKFYKMFSLEQPLFSVLLLHELFKYLFVSGHKVAIFILCPIGFSHKLTWWSWCS